MFIYDCKLRLINVGSNLWSGFGFSLITVQEEGVWFSTYLGVVVVSQLLFWFLLLNKARYGLVLVYISRSHAQ